MADISVTNTTSDLSGKTLETAEGSYTVTGLKTFDRDPNPPFAVSSGSAKVSNLDADLLDGKNAPTGDIVGTSDTQTLTNKTLTAPAISGGGSLAGTFSGDPTLSGVVTFSGSITASAQPRCSLENSAAQSVNNDTETALTFDTEEFDVGALHDTGSNTSRITIPAGQGGLYLVIGAASFAADGDGLRQLFFAVNGAEVGFRHQDDTPSATNASRLVNTMLLNLAAADYVELFVRHTAGAALNIGAATENIKSRFQAVRIW
jgi:hypothetical protein